MRNCIVVALILSMLGGSRSAHSQDKPAAVDFKTVIAPILESRCLRCHQPGNRKGDLSLATAVDLQEQEYLAPGQPDESRLLEVVSAAEGERPEMPKEGTPLSKQEVALLETWIAQGADWPTEMTLREPSKADKSWWSLRPLSNPQPPVIDGIPKSWNHNVIDRFVFAKLTEKGLEPSSPADKRSLIRRATYDLTGLPPTPEEVQAFLNDRSQAAYEKVVERLLASEHYGERWGRHWLDVIRFGESRGYERNEIINNAWPFRDYIIRSFNVDKPFDRLVQEHLAGDVIGKDDPDVEVGTTYLVCGPYDDVGNQDAAQAAQIRANTIDDIIRTTGETFLGLTVGCARCHNHKFDPIIQEDYYSLYATFAGVHHGNRVVATKAHRKEHTRKLEPFKKAEASLRKRQQELEKTIAARAEKNAAQFESRWTRPVVKRSGTEETFSPVRAKYVKLIVEGLDTNPSARRGYRLEEFEVWTAGASPRNVALSTNGGKAEGASRVANDFADAYSARLAIDGRFSSRWLADGPELTITLAQPEQIERVFFCSDRSGEARNQPVATFVGEYRIVVSLDGKMWADVATSHDRKPNSSAHRNKRLFDLTTSAAEKTQRSELDRELAAVRRKIAAVGTLPSWWVGNFKQAAGPFHVFVGGNPQRKGKQVIPASLSMLSEVAPGYSLSADAPHGERRLALAKWITAADNPITPRVLANRIWHYHFGTGIVDTPSDFGYMGGNPTHPKLLDWLARELRREGWRLKPLHRLIMLSQTYRQSSAFRNAAAQIDSDSRYLWRFPPRRLSGEEIRDTLLSVAGKLDKRMYGPGFRLYRYIQDNVATYIPLDRHGTDTYRRAVYHQNARAARVDLMTDFDCPDNAFAAPKRSSTVTPLQALTLMNHQFGLEMSDFWAERLELEAGAENRSEQVARAFELAYARSPADEEREAAVKLIDQHGLRAFCRALINSNEFIYLD